jgi:hypothetical protein
MVFIVFGLGLVKATAKHFSGKVIAGSHSVKEKTFE